MFIALAPETCSYNIFSWSKTVHQLLVEWPFIRRQTEKLRKVSFPWDVLSDNKNKNVLCV